MGQITIQVPQKIKRSYRITDRDVVQKLLSDLEKSDTAKALSAEDSADVRAAKKARTEYLKTGESSTVADLREEFGL